MNTPLKQSRFFLNVKLFNERIVRIMQKIAHNAGNFLYNKKTLDIFLSV